MKRPNRASGKGRVCKLCLFLFRRENLALWTGLEQNGSAFVWFDMEYWSTGVMDWNIVEGDYFFRNNNCFVRSIICVQGSLSALQHSTTP